MIKHKRGRVMWLLGIILALFGAFTMWHSSLFGDNNTSIAIVIGIVGLVLIATHSGCCKAEK